MVSRGTITQEEREFVEEWENIAQYQNAILRLDVRGEIVHEVVTGMNRPFYITTEERMLTQSRVVDEANDPFKNGSFRPITVPDSVTVETNPNALGDDEILEIFRAGDFAWDEWIKTLDSPATLQRMIALADEAEGATVKRLRQLEARYREVKPQTRIQSKDETLNKFLNEPASGGRERRGQGGRSKAYRDS